MSIANEILCQLGGNRFTVMTGSNHYLADGPALVMHLAKNPSRANRLRITLQADDTYSMVFTRFTPSRFMAKTCTFTEEKTQEIARYDSVYCDQLQELFTLVTKLYTHL